MRWRSAMMKTALPIGLSVLLLAISTTDGHGVNGTPATVSITTVSGYAGHAFVYAQVSQSTIAYPAPTGTGHQSPTSPSGFRNRWPRRHVNGSGRSTFLTGQPTA